jgi:hypothetical protein
MTTIDTDSAKLAGLQIDMLQKVRGGHITLSHLEWFTGLNKTQRDMLSGADLSKLSDNRFELINTFEVIVPEGYDHATRLGSFKKAHKKEFYYFNDAIMDENFAKATTQLTPGRKFAVKVFQINTTVTSEDCLAQLKRVKAVLVGAQGISLAMSKRKRSCRCLAGPFPLMKRKRSGKTPMATTGCRAWTATRMATSGSASAASGIRGSATAVSSLSAT